MQIRTRLTLQFTLLVSTIVLLSFLAIYFFASQFTEQDFERRLREKAITSAILLIKVDQVDTTLLKIIDRAKRDNLYRETIRVFDDEGKEIYHSGDTIRLHINQNLIQEVQAEGERKLHYQEFTVTGIPFRDRGKDYVIIALAEDVNGYNRLVDLRRLLMAQFFILIGLVFISGWIYSGRALRPIQKVIADVQSISPQNLAHRLEESKHPDEIGKLISIFNGLLTRIENAFKLQKMFVSNVSHELKNPLTNITSQLEVTLLNERPREEYQRTIESVLDDIKSLNHLSVSLLDLARLTQDSDTFSMAEVRLDEILWDARERVQAIDAGYRVEVIINDMPEDENKLVVNGNPHLLKTAFQNLIENACKFSHDGRAEVILTCKTEALEVTVVDKGPGIEKKDLENVFQPFFRTDATSKVKGYGVGLSLSQRIISIHKGKISIESVPGKGTRISVLLVPANGF
ncbi:MAG: HAMP domain-containing histidine kinase [Cyclobacteriaceae bacterium]|nr:HAMP domain-containing histidine kinase [Cyclobacteriaceae bacterium]